VTFASLLIDTCTILEDTGTVPDAYGTVTPNWTPVTDMEDIPCRLATGSGREVTIGAEVVIADYKLYLEDALGTLVITEQNRVRIAGIDYDILLVANRQDGVGSHHKQLWLRITR